MHDDGLFAAGYTDGDPPYLEVFSFSPILAIRLRAGVELLQRVPAAELVQWAHSLEPLLHGTVTPFGVYKAPCRDSGTLQLFCINPELAPRKQASAMLLAAMAVKAALQQVAMPPGLSGVWDMALHAGEYAGAVVGKSSWTYE
jgi:hypothetical protein